MAQTIEQTIRQVLDWDSIEWNDHKDHVRRIQERSVTRSSIAKYKTMFVHNQNGCYLIARQQSI